MINDADLKCEIIFDKPKPSSMWPVGYDPGWIIVTHVPSMTQIRVYYDNYTSQHKVRSSALLCLEMLVDEFGKNVCTLWY
jgi:hypothetical protein